MHRKGIIGQVLLGRHRVRTLFCRARRTGSVSGGTLRTARITRGRRLAALNGSPLRRAKAWGLKRNAALVLGNLGDPAARPALQRALDHTHPVVADQARWSLDRL